MSSAWQLLNESQNIVPTPGIEPGPPAWKAGILTTRPYGRTDSKGLQTSDKSSRQFSIFWAWILHVRYWLFHTPSYRGILLLEYTIILGHEHEWILTGKSIKIPRFSSSNCTDVPSLWRNRLARSAVNRKVGGSSPPRDVPVFVSNAMGKTCVWHQSNLLQSDIILANWLSLIAMHMDLRHNVLITYFLHFKNKCLDDLFLAVLLQQFVYICLEFHRMVACYNPH